MENANIDSIVRQLKEYLAQQQQTLTAAGVTEIVGEYSGCGDEGCFEGVSVNGDCEVPERIAKLIEELSDYVQEPGYQNNDGGGGYITLNVEAGSIVHSSYWNVMETHDNPEVELLNGTPDKTR